MSESYNPIVRSYGELHEVLTRVLSLAENEIRADTGTRDTHSRGDSPFDVATHPRARRETARIDQLPQDEYLFLFFTVLLATVGVSLWLWTWTALFFVIPIGYLAYLISRPMSIHFPIGMRTVGELAFYMIRFSEHKDSGHRWTSDEIALRVCMVLAESLGVPLERVRRENRMVDMENW